jgi:hypothetical protein
MNIRIKHCPDVIVYHEARDSLRDFLKWQYRRGISSYIFSKKVSNRKNFLRLRLWSTKNVVKHGFSDPKGPLIFCLLAISYMAQFIGFLYASKKSNSLAV